MEEALRAGGHGLLGQHDALVRLVAEELERGEPAGGRHVEMLPTTRRYDQALCCSHVGLPPSGSILPSTGPSGSPRVRQPRPFKPRPTRALGLILSQDRG